MIHLASSHPEERTNENIEWKDCFHRSATYTSRRFPQSSILFDWDERTFECRDSTQYMFIDAEIKQKFYEFNKTSRSRKRNLKFVCLFKPESDYNLHSKLEFQISKKQDKLVLFTSRPCLVFKIFSFEIIRNWIYHWRLSLVSHMQAVVNLITCTSDYYPLHYYLSSFIISRHPRYKSSSLLLFSCIVPNIS